jgi:hypothetical protein
MPHTDNILNKGVRSSQVKNLTTGVIQCDWHPAYHLSYIDVSPHVLYYCFRDLWVLRYSTPSSTTFPMK